MADRPEPPDNWPWEWANFSWCPDCGAPHEIVRPGKTQPTCECHLRCPLCGGEKGWFSPGEVAERMSGFLCPRCDADD